jgi:hypothetical protein
LKAFDWQEFHCLPFPNGDQVLSVIADGAPLAPSGLSIYALLGPTQRPDMPAIAAVLASPSPHASPTYNASKSKFRNLSKHVPAGASLAFGEHSPHAWEPWPRRALAPWEQQLTTWQQQLTTSFSRTFDSKAEATRPGDKTSLGLNARLARASMTNLAVGSKSCDLCDFPEWQQQHNVDGRLRRGPHSHSGTP